MIPTKYLITEQEKKEERRDRIQMWIYILLIIAALAILVYEGLGTAKAISLFISDAEADGVQEECWVLCHPESYVILRGGPGKRKQEIGGVTFGSAMMTDGKIRNGFLHVLDLAAEEESGWICARYIVYSEPREVNAVMRISSQGRVACRKWIGGKIIRWMKDGDTVTVYAMCDEWAVTKYGYIMSAYLEAV